MKTLSLYYKNERLNIATPLVVACLITLFLFYIDEGYYSFEWMRDPWNFYPFAVYVIGMTLGQLIVASFLFRKVNGFANTVVVFLLGLPAGVFMSLVLIVCIGLLSLIFG